MKHHLRVSFFVITFKFWNKYAIVAYYLVCFSVISNFENQLDWNLISTTQLWNQLIYFSFSFYGNMEAPLIALIFEIKELSLH